MKASGPSGSSLRVIATVAGVLIGLLVIYYVFVIIPRGELGRKGGWAILQGIELEHRRDSDVAVPLVLSNANGSQYSVLGIPTGDPKFPRAWLILNAAGPNGEAMVLPEHQLLQLQCSYVRQLESQLKIEPAPMGFLRRSCS